MPSGSVFILALVVQVGAQAFGGAWGAAIGGLLIALMIRGPGAFRVGVLAALVAAALLLGATALRGAAIGAWAGMIAANFSMPAWGIVALTLLLPALQSGGIAGGVGRVLQKGR